MNRAVDVTPEDRDLLERASRTEGVEHTRLAAVARATMKLLDRFDAMQERLEKLEAATAEDSKPRARKTG